METETRIIETHPFALVVKGDPLPIDEFGYFVERAEGLGFDLLDAGAATALKALVVATSADRQPELRRHCEEQAAAEAGGDKLLNWLAGPDTGTSSRTIAAALATPHLRTHHRLHLRHGENPPWDPDDFGRCYRLLELFPEWRGRLGVVAAADPRWQGLVDHWGELEELWREESPGGRAPKLYARMKELLP